MLLHFFHHRLDRLFDEDLVSDQTFKRSKNSTTGFSRRRRRYRFSFGIAGSFLTAVVVHFRVVVLVKLLRSANFDWLQVSFIASDVSRLNLIIEQLFKIVSLNCFYLPPHLNYTYRRILSCSR